MRINNRYLSGVTLISLLIGIALGSFLIVTMLQIFATSRANYQLSRNVSEMDSTLRYVTLIMSDIVTQAGYRTPDATTGVQPNYSSAFVPFNLTLIGPDNSNYSTSPANSDDPAGVVISYFPGETVFVSDNSNTDLQDKLWVKFQGDPAGRIKDCNDLYGIENVAILVRFYSRVTSEGVGYYCERQDSGQTYTYTLTPTGTPLIPPALFDEVLVRYGEDITGNGFIDRWSLGSDVQDRNRVYAVRAAFLIHSRENVRSDSVTQTFEVFGNTLTRTGKKIWKLYTVTMLLPNVPNYPLASFVGTP